MNTASTLRAERPGRLGRAELSALWQQFKEHGCPLARTQLIEAHTYLGRVTARNMARKLPASVDRGDLEGCAYVGLVRAVDQYDPSRRILFRTYAITLIRGAILEGLREADWVPRTVRDRAKQMIHAERAFEDATGRLPDAAELEVALGWTTAKLLQERSLCARAPLVSLAEPTYVDGGVTLRIEDALVSEACAPWEAAWKTQRMAVLRQQVDRLPIRERTVVTLYYAQSRTFQEIGAALGVSESRAYQLHAQALRRLRGYVLGNEEAFV